jgi:hypothetical protein
MFVIVLKLSTNFVKSLPNINLNEELQQYGISSDNRWQEQGDNASV